MAATALQANWSPVTYTPSGGSLLTFTKIDDVTIRTGGQLTSYSGDADRFPTTIVSLDAKPGADISTSNPAQFMALPPGTFGVLSATHLDAKLAATGAIVYTLINAVVEDPDTTGKHAAFGTGTVSFQCFSSDGVTNPINFVRS